MDVRKDRKHEMVIERVRNEQAEHFFILQKKNINISRANGRHLSVYVAIVIQMINKTKQLHIYIVHGGE